MAQRVYDECYEWNMIGQCTTGISAYSDIEETKLDPEMHPYVLLKHERQPDVGTLAQADRIVPVVTRAGTQYAVDMFVSFRGYAAAEGEPAERLYWRVLDVRVHPTSFVVNGDKATLFGRLSLSPTPIYAVMLRQDPPAPRPHISTGQRVRIHYAYDDDMQPPRWSIVL
jgi:hypothetical protein